MDAYTVLPFSFASLTLAVIDSMLTSSLDVPFSPGAVDGATANLEILADVQGTLFLIPVTGVDVEASQVLLPLSRLSSGSIGSPESIVHTGELQPSGEAVVLVVAGGME